VRTGSAADDRLFFARHRDVARVLRDPRLSRQIERYASNTGHVPTLHDAQAGSPQPALTLLDLDPPEHTRLRRLVRRSFGDTIRRGVRKSVETVIDPALDAASADGGFEAVSAVCDPIAFTVVSDLVGTPRDDRPVIESGLAAITAAMNRPSGTAGTSLERSIGEMIAGFARLVGQRRLVAEPDLVSGMVRVRDGDDRISDDELIATILLLHLAGIETTSHFLGSALQSLASHPQAAEEWRADPGIRPDAFEELLRFESPAVFVKRVATQPLAIGDAVIEAGEVVAGSLVAANRDPERFEQPDQLWLRRPNAAHHLSFGAGPHLCLGAGVARMAGVATLEAVLQRFTMLRIAARPVRIASESVNGLAVLPLHVEG
jgi:cytochrome P450